MSYDMQQRNEFLKPASTTEFRLDVKRIGSNQHGSSNMRAPVPPANRTIKFPSKLTTKDHVGQSSSGFRHEANKKLEHSREMPPSVYGNGKYDDEGAPRKDDLVRYMSNLPDYLLRAEKGEKFQLNALNVGVLDWGRLETWKCKQNGTRARGGSNASCSGSDNLLLKKPCKSSTAAVSKKKPNEAFISLTSKEKVSYRYDHSQHDRKSDKSTRSAQDFQDEILLATEGQRWIPFTYKSHDKNHADISLTKGKRADQVTKITSRYGTSASNSHCGITVIPQEHANDCRGEDECAETCLEREGRQCNFVGDMGFFLSKSDPSAPSLCSSKSIQNNHGGRVKMVESVQGTNIDVGSEECPRKGSNIVLLVPNKKNQNRLPQNSHQAEIRTVAYENVRKPRQISIPDGLPEKAQFVKFNSENLCPTAQPPGDELNKLSNAVPRSQDQDTDFSSVVSRSSSCSDKASSLLSETTYEDCDESDMKAVSQHTDTILRGPLDNGTAEMTSKRSRHSSPTRRFSFSLSRIGRSFSFKEGSSVPRFSSGHSSVKSGPVTVESSTGLDNSNKEKLIAHKRSASSSPFRRLLDPLRKHKAADSLHPAETPQGLKKDDAMSSMINNVGESLILGKNDGSAMRAVLHHTVKNGLPLYKFMVNNESSILVTTVKNLSSYEKDSKACNFTIYAVDVLKKKSGGWIGLGGKEKSCGYVYNVVGQMKDGGSHFSELNCNNSLKQCTKEYVLLGVETKQDPGSPKVNHSKELAAAVIRIPHGNFINGELPRDIDFMEQGCNKFLAKEHCPCSSGEDEIFSSATVILAGGVHGSPNNGAPSPLIFRWKSGGSCDCGGWDIGCKLHVLHSQKQSFGAAECRTSCALSGHLELYLEGKGEQSRVVFSMAPLKNGMRSVEFRSPISVLQAFFICVAVESSEKSSSVSELYSLHDLFAKESSSKENDGFHFQGNAPAKYTTPNPPLSPVGRV